MQVYGQLASRHVFSISRAGLMREAMSASIPETPEPVTRDCSAITVLGFRVMMGLFS